jgi:hypothetical protein
MLPKKNQNIIQCYRETERELVTAWRNAGEKIKMGKECGTHGTEKECICFGRKIWM